MSRTITAMFDTRSEAEAAKARLQNSNIDADRVRIVDQASGTAGGDGSSTGESKGFFAGLADMFMPEEDRHSYNEGIRRGGYLISAEVDDHEADEACRVLDEGGSVDFDEREAGWRSEGWQGYAAGGVAPTPGQPAAMGTFDSAGSSSSAVNEERIPIMEEELRVGKREVERGSTRVRSYVREIPVHEQVALREEHVSVERRPVNEQLSSADAAGLMQERTIEMTETAEEAVIGKNARVVEEVVVRKTQDERIEQIDDTVRRTEVEIDEDAGSRPALSGLSGTSGLSGADDNRGGLTGDRDRDGMPNLLDTTDRGTR